MDRKNILIISIVALLFMPEQGDAQSIGDSPPATAVIRDIKGAESLMYYSAFGRVEDVKIILSRGVDPNSRNNRNWPAIAIAADRKDDEGLRIVEILVAAGADVNATDEDGNSALVNAVKNRNAKLVTYLLDANADLRQKDKAGRTAFELAKAMHYSEISKIMDVKITAMNEAQKALRSDENLKQKIFNVSFFSCVAKYNKYIAEKNLFSTESEKADRLTVYDRAKSEAEKAGAEVIKIFSYTQQQISDIMSLSATTLTDQLDYLGDQRKSKEFGTSDAISKRCTDIARRWQVKKQDRKPQ